MLLIALLPAVLAQGADAGQRLQLEWRAPQSCPVAADFQDTLEHQVPLNRTFAASVTIAEPRAEGELWSAVVLTGEHHAQRRRVVEAPDCGRINIAALLVVTLAATQLASDTEPPPLPVDLPPLPETQTSPPPDVAPPARPTTPPPADDGLNVTFGLQPTVAANLGLMPVVGASLGASATAWLHDLRLSLGVAGWLDGRTSSPTRGARFSTSSLDFHAAWLIRRWSPWLIMPTAGVEALSINARGIGIAAPEEKTTTAVATFLGALLGRQVSKTQRAWLGLEVGLMPLRPTFLITTPSGDIVAHGVSLLVGRLSLGFEFEVFAR